MTTIQIAHEVPDEKIANIRALLAETSLRDINWNGAKFRIVRGDFTCIPKDNSSDAVSLFYAIQGIISGDYE